MMILDRIKALCKERNTNISALEKQLGLGNGTISRWENAAPTVNKLSMVADFFNVSLDYLVRGK